MFRGLAAFVMLACATAFGQGGTAQINFVGDDTGYVWVNGQQITVDTNWVGYAPVHPGKNVLAFWVWDHCWTGGFCASLDFGNGIDTPHTDATVRCTDYPVAGGTGWLSDTNYDDSQWQLAGDYGALADDTGGNAKRLFLNTGIKVAQLWDDKAHWIWGPKRVFFRKSFTAAAAASNATVFLKGNGFSYNVFLNGTQILTSATRIVWGTGSVSVAGRSVRAGENVIAIDATCLDSVDFAWIKCGIRGPVTVNSDTSWRMAYTEQTGWNNYGFSASTWRAAGIKNCQYDGVTDALTSVQGIWSTDMAFRMVFEVKGPVQAAQPKAAAALVAKSVVRTEYYSLSGKLIPAAMVNALRANTVVVERSILSNGTSVSRTMRSGL